MTFKTYDINIDLVKDASTACAIRFSQNDRNSAKLLLTITNKGAELDLSQAKSVRMSFKKPDGTRIFQNDCQPINALKGKYQILLKTQTLAAVGNVIAQIHIEEEDRTIDSQKFFFIVNESLASNEAIESTNEFPVIQKAIEAGKKLEGVDINGIIAAGAKAEAALPKTGGTMTGDIKFNVSGGNKEITATDGTNDLYKWIMRGTNFEFFSQSLNKGIFNYNNVTGMFNVTADTNLVKKTGDTITGLMTTTDNFRFKAGGERNITWRDGNDTEYIKIFANSGGNRLGLWSTKNSKSVWEYNGDTDMFSVNTNTNLLKKTGDAMSGDLTLDVTTGGGRQLRWVKGVTQIADVFSSEFSWAARRFDGTIYKDFLKYNYASKQFDIIADKMTFSKDGRANLILTADAENFNGNIGPIADRRGNTVTVRAGFRRKSGATGTVMTTLPADMRPTMTIINVIPATDGTLARVSIMPTGEVHIESAGNTPIMGKDVYIACTFIVD